MDTVNSNLNQSKVKMKVIPWHCQQRYQSSLSQISLNHTITTAQYNHRVKSLLHNNKCLAKALERSRYELAEKENIALENTKNIDIISFTGIKLKDLSNNLRKITATVDETLEMLGSYASTKTSQNFQLPSRAKRDFKNKIRAVQRMDKLEEVAEVIENPMKSTNKRNFKKHQPPLLVNKTPKNGKDTSKATACKNKSKKQCLSLKKSVKKPVIVERASKCPADNETPPSYLLGVSSELDNFESLVLKSKGKLDCKPLESEKPPKPKNQKHKSKLHLKKSNKKKQDPEPPKTKLTITIKNGEVVSETKPNVKAALCRKSNVNSGRRVSFTKSQSSSDSLSSSEGKSFECTSSSSSEDSIDKVNINLQKTTSKVITSLENNKTSSCLKPNSEMDEAYNEAYSLNNAAIFTDLDCVPLSSHPKIPTISIHKIDDADYSEHPKNSGVSNKEAATSAVLKKKVQFQLDREDVIEMLSDSQDSLPKPNIKKPQKRPLRDNVQNYASMPKRQALYTVGGELDKVKVNGENTYIVTAEVHNSPESLVRKKMNCLKDINHPNMQPYVLLTDIFKSSLHNSAMEVYKSQLVTKEPNKTKMVNKGAESFEMACSEDRSNGDLDAMYDKENKIDEQNFLEERKPGRRTSTKVTCYKEMKLNVKMRRC